MKFFIGTKRINAKTMTRKAYNDFRGWRLPSDENGDDEGYLVEYLDGSKANTKSYEGYVSWSPKEQFEKAYKSSGEMAFGHAVELLKSGHKVTRTGWNGKGMWLCLIEPQGCELDEQYEGLPYIAMKTADDKLVPWLASQSDVLANDWLFLG